MILVVVLVQTELGIAQLPVQFDGRRIMAGDLQAHVQRPGISRCLFSLLDKL